MTGPTTRHIGFTGTRHGMTPAQRHAVSQLIAELAAGAAFTAHHGDCVGADAEFHDLCRSTASRRSTPATARSALV
jgi:hypothetical protein